jgi:hypothetical protein
MDRIDIGDVTAAAVLIAGVTVNGRLYLYGPFFLTSPGVCTERDRCGVAYDAFDTMVLALAVSDAAAATGRAAAVGGARTLLFWDFDNVSPGAALLHGAPRRARARRRARHRGQGVP